MESEYIKGKEVGQIMQGLKDLGRNVDNGFKKIDTQFSGLDCSGNKEKINTLFTDYIERRDTKKFLFRTAMKKLIPMVIVVVKYGTIAGFVAGTAYALAK